MREAFIFDVDGTLANTDHRVRHLEKTPKDGAAWHASAHLDTCHAGVAAIARALYRAASAHVVICTSREQQFNEATVDWLRAHDIPFDRLMMRINGDRRDDDEVKREFLADLIGDGYEILGVFEDRARVVAMWRREGIPCYQVAPGEF